MLRIILMCRKIRYSEYNSLMTLDSPFRCPALVSPRPSHTPHPTASAPLLPCAISITAARRSPEEGTSVEETGKHCTTPRLDLPERQPQKTRLFQHKLPLVTSGNGFLEAVSLGISYFFFLFGICILSWSGLRTDQACCL